MGIRNRRAEPPTPWRKTCTLPRRSPQPALYTPPKRRKRQGFYRPIRRKTFLPSPLKVPKNIPINARIVDVLEVRFALSFTLVHLLQLSLIGRGLASTAGLIEKLYQIG